MQLLVPTNWDPDLILPLSKLDADVQIYGVLPTSMIGSGGTGPDNIRMVANQVEEYIEEAHSAGLKFDYLLNAPSMGNMEWDENTHRELLMHLDWITSIGADSVTVTIPYLVELIKRQFPQLQVRVSTIAHVNSVARAKLFESLGADSITLDINVNRSFGALRAIRNTVSCELTVLLNNLCLYQCPYEYYHHDGLGHASQNYNPVKGSYVDYCVLRCTLDRLRDVSQVIKCRWGRPEDIHIYEDIGIDMFKISGRSMPTEKILRAAKAYSSRHCQGNLYDILNVIIPRTGFVNSTLPGEQSNGTGSSPSFYIDNQALEGFMDFFRKQDCSSGCSHCGYCQRIADRVMQFDRDEVDEYVAALNQTLDNLSSSRIFKVKAGAKRRPR
ncbi:MAG: U32 family peptidase [Dehalococcoidia bacterium]|nr:U32 family peptidase [Dehalococcoidia bacterium]MDH4367831.1 U32 family peptidase [Dehalococcoidia bacterium]